MNHDSACGCFDCLLIAERGGKPFSAKPVLGPISARKVDVTADEIAEEPFRDEESLEHRYGQ